MGGRRVHVNALLLRVSLSPQKKLGLQMKKFYPFDRDWIGQLPSAPNSGDSRVAGGPKRRRSLQLQGNSEWKRRISSSTTRPCRWDNYAVFPHLRWRWTVRQWSSSFLKNLIKRGDEDSYLFDGRLPALQQSKGIVCRQRWVAHGFHPMAAFFLPLYLSISPLQLFLNFGKKGRTFEVSIHPILNALILSPCQLLCPSRSFAS